MGQEFSRVPTDQEDKKFTAPNSLQKVPRPRRFAFEEALQTEIDSVTAKWPGSGNTREHFKGSDAAKTAPGLDGLRADFCYGENEKNYLILEYYVS